MSERIGETSIVIRTEGDNQGVSVGGDSKNPPTRTSGRNSNTSEIARRLLQAGGDPDAARAGRHDIS